LADGAALVAAASGVRFGQYPWNAPAELEHVRSHAATALLRVLDELS
jgi:hypothetical protein